MSDLTEKEKMLQGLPYLPLDRELSEERKRCRVLVKCFNDSDPEDFKTRADVVKQLFDSCHKSALIEAPFRCDYGYNISIGKRTFINYDCVFLDVNPIEIGEHVMVGPGVHIYTVNHPLDPVERKTFQEFGKKVVIGDNVWIGGKSVICPGVVIGEDSVIGAGSVVTKDVPSNVLAAGNPCRVIRDL